MVRKERQLRCQVAHSGEYDSDERAIYLLLKDPESFVQLLMMREGIVSITYRLRQGDQDVVPETVKTKT